MRRPIVLAVLSLIALAALLAPSRLLAAGAAGSMARQSSDLGTPFDLQTFVDEAVARGDSRIVLPPGRHRVTPTRGVHLRLRGLRDIAIVADDVEIVCTQTTRAVEVEECHGLTLSGLTIDYDPLPYTQGRIINLSADKRVHEVEVLDGYPDASTATTKKYQVFRHDNHALRWVDYFNTKVEALSSKRLRITKTQRDLNPQEKVGDLIAIGSSTEAEKVLPHAVVLQSCSGVRLDCVTVYASNCFAFLENDCDQNVYYQCRVAKRGVHDDPVSRSIPRLRSANADGFHSKRAIKGPQILGCYAHYQGDDCVNINGDYHLVASATGKRLRIIAKHSMDIRSGDVVELTEQAGAVLPVSRVVAIRTAGDVTDADRAVVASLNLQAELHGHVAGRLVAVYDVELDRAVNATPGSLIAATNRRGDGFTVADCDFGHVRSRGIIVKASHGDIRDNRLTSCRAESIKVAAEPYWLESGSASSVQILRNTISDCGSVAIAVYAKDAAHGFAAGGSHRQITISDNHISRSPLPNVFVSSTDGVRLERNQSHAGRETSSSGHALIRSLAAVNAAPSPILLHHCSDVVMLSNTIQ
jgi:hypothetical protein